MYGRERVARKVSRVGRPKVRSGCPPLATLITGSPSIRVDRRSGGVPHSFYGSFHWSLQLATGYQGPEFCQAYQVDPLREAEPAENRLPKVTSASFPLYAKGSKEQDETVRRYGQAQIEGFLSRHLARAYRKQQNAELEAAITQAWGPADGRKLTQADIDRATEEMLAVVLRQLETG